MSKKVKQAIQKVRSIVESTGDANELTYFDYHERRFARMAGTLLERSKPGAQVLDLGSHFLHSSMILTELGFVLSPVDVQEFWNMEVVKKRAEAYGFQTIVNNNFENLELPMVLGETFDVILFTEVLEHITFNPIEFWKRLFLLGKSGGFIYVSTPNSFALITLLRALKNILTFQSIGIGLPQIFQKVTYGHHWKEYSKTELKTYFASLSDGYHPEVSYYSYKKMAGNNLKDYFYFLLMGLGNFLRVFSTDLEVVVHVNKKLHKGWKLKSPEY